MPARLQVVKKDLVLCTRGDTVWKHLCEQSSAVRFLLLQKDPWWEFLKKKNLV